MAWDSKTGQFGQEEMNEIELQTVEQLTRALRTTQPIVVLRVLAELHLHGEDARITELLEDEELTEHWMKFAQDPGLDSRDIGYMVELIQRRKPISVEETTFIYPKDDPHWVQATRVQSTEDAGYVRVWVGKKEYGIQHAGWSDPYADQSKSDCLVKDPELGWLRIWWNDADVEPR